MFGIGSLIGLAIASIASAAISGGISAANNERNIKAQQDANQKNIDMQNAINAQNQYNIEHAHQIEMKDLEAAGLNPVLTATGGSGAPLQTLQAPATKPVMSDLSGISSAISSAMRDMTMLMMANSMSKTNAALLGGRAAETQAVHTPSAYATRLAVKRALAMMK